MSDAAHPARRWVVLMSLMVLLALALSACSAAEDGARAISLKRTFTLTEGQLRTGNQVIWADKITLAAESRIEGDATLIGDSVVVMGAIAGDTIVVADKLVIGPNATIAGNVNVCAGVFERSDSAQVGGSLKEECAKSRRVSVVNLVESGWESWRHSWFFRLSSLVIGSLFFGAIAALGTIVLPEPLRHMSASIHQAPFKTAGVGLLTLLVAFGLTALYAISLLLLFPIVLLPFVITAWVLLVLLGLLGWVAVAEPFGRLLLRRLGLVDQPRMVAAMTGGVALALLLRVWSLFWFTAWIGLVATALPAALGLGAVLVTRLGTRPYRPVDMNPVTSR